MFWKRSLSLLGTTLVASTLMVASLPRSTNAQGILPPFRFGGQPIRELPLGMDRGYKSARSARYYFKIPAPEIPMSRFIITEVTDNFVQKGGRWKLNELELRQCSKLGNALSRPTCEGTIPLQQVTFCSSNGCEVYDAVNGTSTLDPEPYDGLPYLEVTPVEMVPAGTNLSIVLSDVINPRSSVSYQFNLAIETPPGVRNRCQVITTVGNCALGTWIATISNSRNE
ncbi:DUF2808 domain-containing protein [Prochlorothrix hollandica]|uniref:Uncharacterized protein n=1 Tax=Prochlorothrix hollandica PCC 9006 = CALU 1027 TaxID=317619 RepID=A0A0M2PUB9_PROHO|nr:DUF2808 domain-containing protein [Prochlorothrix hollandica]KKI98707.1 hypothetical protein PROH_17850 [Prochlorothrix hollandica PCC 9006 = CALU 1027]